MTTRVESTSLHGEEVERLRGHSPMNKALRFRYGCIGLRGVVVATTGLSRKLYVVKINPDLRKMSCRPSVA